MGDDYGAGPVQRPGQETEGPAPQGKEGVSTRQPRPKLTYELLTVGVSCQQCHQLLCGMI